MREEWVRAREDNACSPAGLYLVQGGAHAGGRHRWGLARKEAVDIANGTKVWKEERIPGVRAFQSTYDRYVECAYLTYSTYNLAIVVVWASWFADGFSKQYTKKFIYLTN